MPSVSTPKKLSPRGFSASVGRTIKTPAVDFRGRKHLV
jgi:hypothetical protein